jgi:hypothetical protein
MEMLEVRVPEVPVIVTVDVPAVATLLAVNVSTLLPVVGFVPNAAVTPLGKPETASVALPAKPPKVVIVIVSVALAPGAIVRVGAEGASAKLEHVVPLIAKELGTALVMPFQVPLNPTPEYVAPAGMVPL